MKIFKISLLVAIASTLMISCGDDDDDGGVPIREFGEVYQENIADLEQFLSTNTYNYEDFDPANSNDFNIEITEIGTENADKTPLLDRPELKRYTINRDDIDYDYFVLEVKKGEGELQPTFADSTLITYEGINLSGEVFDSSINPIWFSLPSTIEGFSLGLQRFKESTSFSQNPDGTLTFQDAGIGAVFMPSGLAYYANPPSTGIDQYAPLVFTFNLNKVEIADHDNDGILSIYEDLEGDNQLRTSGGDDTDGDGRNNFIDSDDDGDGIPTSEENADPNGDGNPDDARDTDNDGVPDYLDDNTVGQ